MRHRSDWVMIVILCLGFGAFHAVSTLPGHLHGDEIHYLVMTISLLRDGDLNLVNNYNSPEMLRLNGYSVEPHLIYKESDRGYSSHEPGLPVVMILPYRIAGRAGTVWLMTIAAIVALMQVRAMLRKFGFSDGAAFPLTLASAFNTPFIMMSGKMFPDMPGAAFLALACRMLFAGNGTASVWWGGLALAVLPWFHIKFVIFSGLVALAWFVTERRSGMAVAAVLIPVAVSGLGMTLFQYSLFGDALYSIHARSGGLGLPFPGIAGLLFDREAGLLIAAPVFLPAVTGMAFGRRRSGHLTAIAFIAVIYWIVSGSWIDWHSGHCPPARYLVPLIPLSALFTGNVFGSGGTRLKRGVWAILWTVSMLQVIGVATGMPEMAIVHNDGINRLWDTYLPRGVSGAIPSWLNPGAGLWYGFFGVLLLAVTLAIIFEFPAGRSRIKRIGGAGCLAASLCFLIGAGDIRTRERNELDATPLANTAPDLIAPADGTVWFNEMPDFRWGAVRGADGYILAIRFPDGRDLRIPEYGSLELTLPDGLAEYMPAGAYCWRVVPIKRGREGRSSEDRCFQLVLLQ